MSFTSSNSFIRFNAAQSPNATVSTGTGYNIINSNMCICITWKFVEIVMR